MYYGKLLRQISESIRVVAQHLSDIPKQLSGIGENIDQQSRAMRDASEAKDQKKRNQWPVPLPVVAELQFPEADKREQRAQYHQSRTLQIWLTIGTWLAFGAAAYYAGVASDQLREMRIATEASVKSVEESELALINAQSQFDRTMRQMIYQTTAQARAADAAKAAAKAATDEVELSRRPWIAIDNSRDDGIIAVEPLTYRAEGSQVVFKIHYQMQNTGRSPANLVGYGEMIDEPNLPNSQDYPKMVQRLCSDAKTTNRRGPDKNPNPNGIIPWTYTLVPGSPMEYTILYDGSTRHDAPLILTRQSIEKGNFRPVNIGCFLYKTTTNNGEQGLHQFAFQAKISMLNSDRKNPGPGNDIPINIADLRNGKIKASDLCVTQMLVIGKAD